MDNISRTIEGIAIVGMSGRFPEANNVNQFWQNLRNGKDSICRFSDQGLESTSTDPDEYRHPRYVKASAEIKDIEMFDADFFGFSPNEAETMDPQHRIFLETAWEALENAGYTPENDEYLMGMYAGSGSNQYLFDQFSQKGPSIPSEDYQKMIGNAKDFLAARISYCLNLNGPSFTVQTACSTSLVAIHLACQSLLLYQCDLALAGGIKIESRKRDGYDYQDGMILSPDGYCRAFDARAEGTVPGDGVGIVVLKRLDDAIHDRDSIYAIIKSHAINNDGSQKISFTAPSENGQAQVITLAQALSGIDPESISYVEAHGTGTSLGDPIEIAALTQAFRTNTDKKGFCAIGSVKTNIGHLDAAAGVAGLIKTTLALFHKEIPASLHFKTPNPNIDFENSPFYVNAKLKEWDRDQDKPRRAGVSSFGIGGTNAHVVLEEAPDLVASGPSRSRQLLVLSAKTSKALEAATINFVSHLKMHPTVNLADIAYTLQIGRTRFNHRRFITVKNSEGAISVLESLDQHKVKTAPESSKNNVVFMFPGQGSQYVNMGLELYKNETEVKTHIDRCAEILIPYLNIDLRHILFPDQKCTNESAKEINNTKFAQPALFVIEYALAKLWMSWGVMPTAMVGHSVGEYVAAVLAGVMTLEEGLSLVAIRARLMQELPEGAMLAIVLSEAKVLPYLNEQLSLAAVNSPSLCVISGNKKAIAELEEQLSQMSNTNCQYVHTSHAFHSEMVSPILSPFMDQVGKVILNPPQIPIVSTVTGTWVKPHEMTNPSYWEKNIRQTVRFSDCTKVLFQNPDRFFLEVGPGDSLSSLAKQQENCTENNPITHSLPHPKRPSSDIEVMLDSLGKYWLAGGQINWSGFYTYESRFRVPLPTYPFQRQRYWIDETLRVNESTMADTRLQGTQIRNLKNNADWCYVPHWKSTVIPFRSSTEMPRNHRFLVFIDECGLGLEFVNQLKELEQSTITVQIGKKFGKLDESSYSINPENIDDYFSLMEVLHQNDEFPERIVHFWNTRQDDKKDPSPKRFEKSQSAGFYSLYFIAQSLVKQAPSEKFHIDVISNGIHEIFGGELSFPEQATLLGPCESIPIEHPNITCRSIDVVFSNSESIQKDKLLDQLITEIFSKVTDTVIAYRGTRRWKPSIESVDVDDRLIDGKSVRKDGVYLITNGFEGIEFLLAQYLGTVFQAKLVLVGQSGLPHRDQWEEWLETYKNDELVRRGIKQLQAIEQAGGDILISEADLSNEQQMEVVIANAKKRFGNINGVIHCCKHNNLRENKQKETPEMILNSVRKNVKEAFIISSLVNDANLDFFILCSSISPVSSNNIFPNAISSATNSFF